MPRPVDAWAAARAVTGLRVDHVGLVVRDIDNAIAFFSNRGFALTKAVPLEGAQGPLGQKSAHLMLPNAYLEISAPDPGAGNHLEPYLAKGPGLRILALASNDIHQDHKRLTEAGLAGGAPQQSARTVQLAEGEALARFSWFPLRPAAFPEVLVAVVQHLTPEIVFAPELVRHPNGARRFLDVLADGDWQGVADPVAAPDGFPPLLTKPSTVAKLRGLTIAVTGSSAGVAGSEGFALRTVDY